MNNEYTTSIDSPRNPFDEMEQRAARLGALKKITDVVQSRTQNSIDLENNLINYTNFIANTDKTDNLKSRQTAESISNNLQKLNLSNAINESYDDLNATIPQLVDDDEDDLKSLQLKCPLEIEQKEIIENKRDISPGKKIECLVRLNEIKQKSLETAKTLRLKNIKSSIEMFMKDYDVDSTKSEKYLNPLLDILSGIEIDEKLSNIPAIIVRQSTFDIENEPAAIVRQSTFDIENNQSSVAATPLKSNKSPILGRRLSQSISNITKRRSLSTPHTNTPTITKKRVSLNPSTQTKENISPGKVIPRRSLYLTPNKLKFNIAHQSLEDKTFLPSPHVAAKTKLRFRSRSSVTAQESNNGPLKAMMMKPPAITSQLTRSRFSMSNYLDTNKQIATVSYSSKNQLTPRSIPSRSKICTPVRQ